MTPAADSVHALVERAAERQPQGLYAISAEGGEPLTFEALRRSCVAVGAWLRERGVGPGDTVAFVMPNGLQTMRLLLGAMHAGVCVNPINLLAQPEQMRYVLDHSDCSLVFVAPEWEERIRAMAAEGTRPVQVLVASPDANLGPDGAFGSEAAASGAACAEPDRDAAALLMYTSGTTGVPKGVILSHANLAANAAAIGIEHGLGAADRVLAVLPLYHINAFVVTMLAPLAHGGSLAMTSRFSAAQFWRQAIDSNCTWLNVVPTIISYLLEGEAPPRESLARIRFCRSASAALPPEQHRAFEAKFGIGIVETMGLTETAAPAFSNPLDPARRKVGSVGRASGGEARVVDASLQPVADGSTGEIVLRGPHVMRGYYKNPEATAATFTPDGWLRTGDLGHRDADGFFFVTGRIKELIIKGGENIAPREIDDVLIGHPAVREAAAVGIPDRHYGQEIMACVVLRADSACSEDELRDFCVQRLGRYKAPKVIRFVASLPRGPSGKVQRLKLLDAATTG
ncbi:MAG TPA: AMP-binding protein [Caldimonas sp.]|jgi:acyl-CoA synthetase (AMP-forming)/AMP-acid ligase II|nr:AMP-binding protein [Caldimonas sp.]HEX2542750.1 AMP-binding protein [Caldimonas sp.]